jgi:hypothetical protein
LPARTAAEAAPLLRFVPPSTHQATGSDLHRVCLTRLCDAFRLSQPLGVSFLPEPFRPCFVPVTPLGFALQRFVPLACRRHLSVRLPLVELLAKRPAGPGRHVAASGHPEPPRTSARPVIASTCRRRHASWRATCLTRASPQSYGWVRVPGAPCSVTRRGGRRNSPSVGVTTRRVSRPVSRSRHPGSVVVGKCRRLAHAGGESPFEARGHRVVVSTKRNRIAAPGSRERSPVVPIDPPGCGLVRFRPLWSLPVVPVENGPGPRKPNPPARCRTAGLRKPRSPSQISGGERLADPRSESEACWPSSHSPQTIQFPAGPKTDHPLARAARLQTRLQGFEPRESPCYQPSGVTRMVGADPLLGFHLPRVLPLPGAAVPLYGLLSRTYEERAPKRPPPRASESRHQGGWLASLEGCRPFRVFRPRPRHVPRAKARRRVPFVSPGQVPRPPRGLLISRPSAPDRRSRAVDHRRSRRFAVGFRPTFHGPTRTSA